MTLYITPFGQITRRRMIERMLDPDWNQRATHELFFPVDVKAESDAFTITALLPGIHSDDLNIQIVNETVTIQAEMIPSGDEKTSYLVREIPSGSYSRVLTLPTALDADTAEAHLENGLLTLKVPKAETVRPRTIKVVSR